MCPENITLVCSYHTRFYVPSLTHTLRVPLALIGGTRGRLWQSRVSPAYLRQKARNRGYVLKLIMLPFGRKNLETARKCMNIKIAYHLKHAYEDKWLRNIYYTRQWWRNHTSKVYQWNTTHSKTDRSSCCNNLLKFVTITSATPSYGIIRTIYALYITTTNVHWKYFLHLYQSHMENVNIRRTEFNKNWFYHAYWYDICITRNMSSILLL